MWLQTRITGVKPRSPLFCSPDLWLLFPTLGYSIVFPFFGKGEGGASPTPQSAYLLPSLIAAFLWDVSWVILRWTREWATWSFLRRRQNELLPSPYSGLLFSFLFHFLFFTAGTKIGKNKTLLINIASSRQRKLSWTKESARTSAHKPISLSFLIKQTIRKDVFFLLIYNESILY